MAWLGGGIEMERCSLNRDRDDEATELGVSDR
jgi:hypothetical protein